MHFNVNFDTYRRSLASGKRSYSGTKTITLGAGYRAPLTESLRATLGVDASAETYILYTDETDIEVADKMTISSTDYYVDGVSKHDIGNRRMTRVILNKIKT
jgi:hypothetical protein